VPNVSLFEKSNETMSFISKCFSKHFVKTRWLIFFVLRNADYLRSKVPRNSPEEKFS